jgi:GNAT superfamily N-acetyltransferase
MVAAMAAPRPMRDADAPAVLELMIASFTDLDRRTGRSVEPPPDDPTPGLVRIRHLVATDPGGAWVADDGDGIAAAALAIVRDGVWGLSLLVVRPGAQSGGLGGALLRRALDYGTGARGGIILSSPDPRALRSYARAGFTLHPALEARGAPRGVEPAAEVVPADPADRALTDPISRAVRGAAHGADIEAAVASGAELLAWPGRGFALTAHGVIKLLAALDEEAAAALLRTALARADATAEVAWITARQQWAVGVALGAGLELAGGGAVFVRGDVGPFHPYLPSGAYL